MTQQIDYKSTIIQGIPLIQQWIDTQEQNIKETEDFKELIKVIQEIDKENDYTKESYEDIRFFLKPFEEQLPLKIKRLFNISVMDQYTMFISSRYFDSFDDYINLIMTTRRFNQILTKYHYNPIPLTLNIREFFTHLQTLYLYSLNDNTYQDDSKIIAREECKVKKYDLFIDQVEQLEKWTGLKCGEILFDSNIDNWSYGTSVFNDKIIGKKQLVFLIKDEDGELFGYYLNSEITIDKMNREMDVDSKTFHFNLQSKNNRLNQPMKFEIKNLHWGGIYLHENKSGWLIFLGDISLRKEHAKHRSCCGQNEYEFDYHEINEALCGKIGSWDRGQHFTPKRILVIQMK